MAVVLMGNPRLYDVGVGIGRKDMLARGFVADSREFVDGPRFF
jgi:hypothetical protein